MKILAIDLGGSTSKCAIFNKDKKILLEFKIKTIIGNILNNLKSEIDKKFKMHNINWKDIDAIGFAIPGFLNNETGIVALAGNLKWDYYNIKEWALKIFNKKIYIINDANAATLGEYWINNKKNNSLLMYTLGTGIGGGIILKGKLWTGENGYAGEFGHGGNFQNTFKCTCGLNNCIEGLSSATGLTKLINIEADKSNNSLSILKKSLKRNLLLKDIENLFKKNDSDLIRIIKKGLNPLVNHIVTMLYALNPELIIISGGVTNLGIKLEKLINDLVKTKISGFLKETFKIQISKLQAKVGVYGAACFAFDNLKIGDN